MLEGAPIARPSFYVVIVEQVVLICDGVIPREEFVSNVSVDHVVQCDVF